MLIKSRVRNKLFDRLHHTAVTICIGVTLLTTIGIGYYGYVYFTQIKPQRKLEQLKIIQEGAHDKDTAKTITPWMSLESRREMMCWNFLDTVVAGIVD